MMQDVYAFELKPITDYRGWLAIVTVAGLLALSGCSGGEDHTAPTDDRSPDVQSATGEVNTAEKSQMPEGFNVHKSVPLADGLIPELSGIPLPDGAIVFEVGSAHNADVDPRETAVQTAHFTISPQELLAFYLTSLPAAGFKINSSVDAFAEASRAYVEFTDTNGIPGRLFFGPGAWSASQMNINLYRSGNGG